MLLFGIALARYVTPPLTTVRQPMLEIGCHAAQILLDLLQEKTVENLVLAPTLVERGSTIRKCCKVVDVLN